MDSHISIMCDATHVALSNNVSVVSSKYIVGACSPTHCLTSQDNYQQRYGQAGAQSGPAERGGGSDVGYTNNPNYAPLIERDKVWEGYKINNNWTQVFFIEDAINFRANALKSAIEMTILGSPRPLSFIHAPQDYLGMNTVEAINAIKATNVLSNASSIEVYGTCEQCGHHSDEGIW